jgi:hypothetical protein
MIWGIALYRVSRRDSFSYSSYLFINLLIFYLESGLSGALLINIGVLGFPVSFLILIPLLIEVLTPVGVALAVIGLRAIT